MLKIAYIYCNVVIHMIEACCKGVGTAPAGPVLAGSLIHGSIREASSIYLKAH